MYDLRNLSDYEFEKLCKDIMEVKINKVLYYYARGVDGGVDIADSNKNPKIIIQAKHYTSSGFTQLLSSLKKDLPKMLTKKPERYYVCTSLELTKKNKGQIVGLFSDFMIDESYVVDKNDINEFLEKEANIDIVNKHNKLWFCSTKILTLINSRNVFFDCCELMDDIKNSIHLFVDTRAYYDAKRILAKNSVVIITGAPGVGKSIISKMLVLHYVNEKYSVRYATDNNIADIKKVISTDPLKKEVILLDDFLGQHYLKMKDSQPNELKTLISNIENSKNKKLILNSRITIMQEAIRAYITFESVMSKHEVNKYVINLDAMSLFDRSKILYNHLFFCGLPKQYFYAIKSNQAYLDIVRHKNYNPRIVEHLTRPSVVNVIKPNGYIPYFFDKLNNPQDVWSDEFNNRIDECDRLLVYTLYSLTNNSIDIKILEKSYNNRLRISGYRNTSVNLFRSVMARLGDSLVKILLLDDARHISVINPSLNDFLRSEIIENVNEQVSIISSAIYAEQIEKVLFSDESKDIVRDIILNKSIHKMKTLGNSRAFYYVKFVLKINLLNFDIKEELIEAIADMTDGLLDEKRDEFSDNVIELVNGAFFSFYQLDELFEDIFFVTKVINNLSMDKIADFAKSIIVRIPSVAYKYSIRDIVIGRISLLAIEDVGESLYHIISNRMGNSEKYMLDSYYNGDSDTFPDLVKDDISEHIYAFTENLISDVDIASELWLTMRNFEPVCNTNFDIWEMFSDLYKEQYIDDEDCPRIPSFNGKSEVDAIIEMFER